MKLNKIMSRDRIRKEVMAKQSQYIDPEIKLLLKLKILINLKVLMMLHQRDPIVLPRLMAVKT